MKKIDEFSRYILVGIGSNCINFSIYFFLKIFFSLFMAAFFGYLAGLLLSYHFGRIWVFGERFSVRRQNLISFLVVYLIGGLGMSGLIEFFGSYMKVDLQISWLIGALFALANNFIGMKWFVFKKDLKNGY